MYDLCGTRTSGEEFRRYLQGLLLPTERQKTLAGLVNTEPLVVAQLRRGQKLQWFLSESTWDERQVQAERLRLLRETPQTAPNGQGALVIDETGDRKDGHKTAHVARQYLGNVGKIDNGVVSVTRLWADEQVYYRWRSSRTRPRVILPKARTIRLFAPNPRSPCSWSSRRLSRNGRSGQWLPTPSTVRTAVCERDSASCRFPMSWRSILPTPDGILRGWQARCER